MSGRRLLAAVVLAVLASLSAGCTGQAAPPPTWSGPTVYIEVPTRTETVPAPPVTSSPTPAQALYDQAVEVYHAFYEQETKLTAAGGAETLPPEMEVLLTGEALALIAAMHRFGWENGHHYVGEPQFQLLWIRPYTTDLPEAAVVAVETCEVITGAMIADGEGTLLDDSDTNYYSYRTYFRYDTQHRLVIFRSTGDEVEPCAA